MLPCRRFPVAAWGSSGRIRSGCAGGLTTAGAGPSLKKFRVPEGVLERSFCRAHDHPGVSGPNAMRPMQVAQLRLTGARRTARTRVETVAGLPSACARQPQRAGRRHAPAQHASASSPAQIPCTAALFARAGATRHMGIRPSLPNVTGQAGCRARRRISPAVRYRSATTASA